MDPVPLCEPWPVSGCASDLGGYPPPVTGVGVMAASELLWALTGRQFGTCDVTVRPCSRSCHEQPYGGWWWYPDRWVSGWPYGPVMGGFMETPCGSCRSGCSCSEADELRLVQPAREIVEVSIDGVVLPPSGYVLYDGDRLVRTDGGTWPLCQNWAATSGPGVFTVEAKWGAAVPALGSLAMGEVLPEMLKACSSKPGECRLPSAVVRSTNRQGISKEFLRPSDVAEVKMLGLPIADRLIQAFNPNHLDAGAAVWNPDDVLDGLGGRRQGGVW